MVLGSLLGSWIGSYFQKRYLRYDVVWLISSHEDAVPLYFITTKNKFWTRSVQFKMQFVPVAWNYKSYFKNQNLFIFLG